MVPEVSSLNILSYIYDDALARFVDLPKNFQLHLKEKKNQDAKVCVSCQKQMERKEYNTPRWGIKIDEDLAISYFDCIKWKNEDFHVGDCVYLNPDSFILFSDEEKKSNDQQNDTSDVDEMLYPELYRKTSYIKGSNLEILRPFQLGIIIQLFEKSKSSKLKPTPEKWLKIKKIYRPEDTNKGASFGQECDMNLVYWSSEECDIKFDEVEGKCYVVFIDNLPGSLNNYLNEGPDRFFFEQAYDPKTKSFKVPPREARKMGYLGKGKLNKEPTGKARPNAEEKPATNNYAEKAFQSANKKLSSLDIFSGCGGLSKGLHQAGVIESNWAIEQDPMAARAFKSNFPNCTVFNEDCNLLLKYIKEGRKTDDKGQHLPEKGKVDLLCGGPPCQGFSGMNRFNSRQYSLFKNSCIVTFLSYVDYFRPRIVIMENVRNFVSSNKNMNLKLTLKTLVEMGYQVSFTVLQAGCFGVPQTRRRVVILATAPGITLPHFPDPTHVFNKRAALSSVMVDNNRFDFYKSWRGGGLSAPFRNITVKDALSDLPTIENGAKNDHLSYNGKPRSHFQLKMRGEEMVLRDHVCKEMSALVEARMRRIPLVPGSDWRDLPNIEVELSNGTRTRKLVYNYHDTKARQKSMKLRGVCPCAEGKPCDPVDRQDNTLIPWCLPHTANRHNNWAGLYGRLDWNGFFGTTVTNPEPMGKQGCVLHPVDNRVVSVRECARSQGFPDSFRFAGSILERHRQVGNAVPPPLARAIGLEIVSIIANN